MLFPIPQASLDQMGLDDSDYGQHDIHMHDVHNADMHSAYPDDSVMQVDGHTNLTDLSDNYDPRNHFAVAADHNAANSIAAGDNANGVESSANTGQSISHVKFHEKGLVVDLSLDSSEGQTQRRVSID